MSYRSLVYVREQYDVPARRGLRVTIRGGAQGVITCGAGAHVRVRRDGEKFSCIYHPLDLDYGDGVDPADRLRRRNAQIEAFNRMLSRHRDREEQQ